MSALKQGWYRTHQDPRGGPGPEARAYMERWSAPIPVYGRTLRDLKAAARSRAEEARARRVQVFGEGLVMGRLLLDAAVTP